MATTRRKRNKRQNRKRYYHCQRLKSTKRLKKKRMRFTLSWFEIVLRLVDMFLTVMGWILIGKSPSWIEMARLLLQLPVVMGFRFWMDK